MSDLAGALNGSLRAEKDLTTPLTTQLLFWKLAAHDGYAKNFTIQVLPQSRYQLTPLYSFMSIWPVEGNSPNQFLIFKTKLAMAVLGKNKYYLSEAIQRRHFNNMAGKYFERIDSRDVIRRILESAPIVIESTIGKLLDGFPNWIAESVFLRIACIRWVF